MNAKTELFELHKEVLVDIKCATISLNERFVNGGKTRQALLKVDHTTEELYAFFNELDFDYDDGYGGQEL
jgi:hypothetical protein